MSGAPLLRRVESNCRKRRPPQRFSLRKLTTDGLPETPHGCMFPEGGESRGRVPKSLFGFAGIFCDLV